MTMNEKMTVITQLADVYENGDNNNLKDWYQIEDISIPLSFAVLYGFATLTDKGTKAIERTYDHLANYAKSIGLDNVDELADISHPLPHRLMIPEL